MQPAEDDGNADRDHRKENQRDQIASENVGPWTNRERKQTRKVAHQLDGQQQRRQQNPGDERHAFHGRPEEMQEIFRSGMFEALGMVVEKCANGAAQRHDGNAGGRLKPGNQADEVANQNEDEDDDEKCSVRLAMMADDFAALVQHEALDRFEGVLQDSWGLDRQPRSQQKENGQQEPEYEQFHGKGIRNGLLRVFRFDVERTQKRRDRSREQAVENLGKPESFRHEIG